NRQGWRCGDRQPPLFRLPCPQPGLPYLDRDRQVALDERDAPPRAEVTSTKSPMSKRYEKIAFVASAGVEAQAALKQLADLYGNHEADNADVVVALGGDGLMLQTLPQQMYTGKPIYGMHRGTVGFLMNEFSTHDLRARLSAARESLINPLKMRA